MLLLCWNGRIPTLCIFLATTLSAFEIRPIVGVTVSVPVTISWAREFSDLGTPTGTWFIESKDANHTECDVPEKTSENPQVSNSQDVNGTITMTFATPGTFAILACEPDKQTPFYSSPPTITVHDLPAAPTVTSVVPTMNASSATSNAATSTMPMNSIAQGHPKADSQRVSIIVGSVVGGISFLLIVAILSWCWCRRTPRVLPGTFRRDMMVHAKSSDNNLVERSQAFALEKSPYIEELSARSSPISLSSSTNTNHLGQNHSFPLTGSRFRDNDNNQTTELGDNIKSPTYTLSSMYTAYTETSEPSHPSIQSIVNARTDRQMQIQEQMMNLYRKMIESRGSSSSIDFDDLRNEIWQLEELQNSDWALELTDVHPHEQATDDVGVAV